MSHILCRYLAHVPETIAPCVSQIHVACRASVRPRYYCPVCVPDTVHCLLYVLDCMRYLVFIFVSMSCVVCVLDGIPCFMYVLDSIAYVVYVLDGIPCFVYVLDSIPYVVYTLDGMPCVVYALDSMLCFV